MAWPLAHVEHELAHSSEVSAGTYRACGPVAVHVVEGQRVEAELPREMLGPNFGRLLFGRRHNDFRHGVDPGSPMRRKTKTRQGHVLPREPAT